MSEADKDAYSLDELLAIMARLRDPERGCPWDAEQDFSSIAPYTIEEAYEVADAIAQGDRDALKDELGDLLLQVVYHAQLAAEEGSFAFADVVDAIARKMVRRHPHVFEDPELRESFLGSGSWEQIKAEEKAAAGKSKAGKSEAGKSEAGNEASVLDDVPVALPALTRAVKLQKRAARVGFDWPSLEPVLAKAEEEIAELKEALQDGRTQRIAEEYGDLLFVMANLGRHLKADPEAALRDANQKFIRRFRAIEAALRERGESPEDVSLEEMDALWDAAKLAEKTAEKAAEAPPG